MIMAPSTKKELSLGDFISYEVKGQRHFGILIGFYDDDSGEKMVKVDPNGLVAPNRAKLSTVKKH